MRLVHRAVSQSGGKERAEVVQANTAKRRRRSHTVVPSLRVMASGAATDRSRSRDVAPRPREPAAIAFFAQCLAEYPALRRFSSATIPDRDRDVVYEMALDIADRARRLKNHDHRKRSLVLGNPHDPSQRPGRQNARKRGRSR